ncbi:hypothetical protein NKJ55_27470 [Mesorhizobium sp. M0106]|uniref:hypothetical protein n=1 Tax=Mesorhizobium sp. M0106 TaxID=2956880 RepID=UPI00333701B0
MPLPSPLCGTRGDRRFSHQALGVISPLAESTAPDKKSDLCQSSTGKRSRQKFKAASITFNNESQPNQIEQKVVDGMCERVRLLFKLKQQGARLFDRGPATVCVYQESILSKICKPSPRPKPDPASNAVGESFRRKNIVAFREKASLGKVRVDEACCVKLQARIRAPPR